MTTDHWNHRSATRNSAVLAAAVAAVLGQPAGAQATAEGAAREILEEVIITAERREQSLQDVPSSALVFSAKNLEEQGISNVIDVQRFAPNVAINTYNRSTFINIRGVGIAQSAPTSSPGVAYYIDGAFIAHEQFISQSFFDIESVEVLRGPQGTLTGQTSTGGAIYVRTPVPTSEGFSGYFDQTIGDYDWYRSVGAVNVPLGERAALRLAATWDSRGSYTKNIGPSPSSPGSGDLFAARAHLRLEPTDAMSFDLRFEYFDRQTDYNAIKNRDDLVTSDPFVIEEDAISYLDQDGYRASIEARFDVGANMQFRALSSYLDADNEDQADGDRTATALPVPPALPTSGTNTRLYPGRVGLTTQSFETWVTEINLLSTGSGDLQWVVGAFYMDETTPVQVLRDNRNTIDFVTSSSSVSAEAENESKSLFGKVDYRLSDAIALEAGLRYSEDQQDYTRFMLPGPPPPGCFPCANTASSSETTGRVGVKYYATDNSMYYATLSKGYKAGGVNLDPRLEVFGPETNEVVEVGVKSTLADGRLRLNGAAFYSNYDGIQLSALRSVGAGPLLPNTLNAAKSVLYGAEFDLTAQFGALGWNLSGAWLHGAFDEDVALTNPLTNVDELVPTGRTLPFTPAATLAAGVQYDFAVGQGLLTPRVQLSYMDKQYSTAFPAAATTVPARTLMDARLSWRPSDQLLIEGFVNNVFDKTYIAVQVQDASSAQGGIIYGAPRHYGVRLKYGF